jgi:hypothetical protein
VYNPPRIMSRPELGMPNPYRFSEIVQYDEKFSEALEGLPSEEVEAAFQNSLLANRILEGAGMAKVLETFAQKYGVTKLIHVIEPSFGFIRTRSDLLHSINTLDLLWFNRNGGPNCQASIAIIDGARMGGYVGARTEGTLIQHKEIFSSINETATQLPVVPQAANAVLSDTTARRIRQAGIELLEDKCKYIGNLSEPWMQAEFISLNLENINPKKVM